ncbi:MAG: hypothetical protein QG657_201 [Acidobacteriota bacterium]|nr:hypothetical protein [Acidobacteriota bacterium]
MKINKVTKKLVLNRTTVANLSDFQMNVARGGVPWTSIGAPHLCGTRCGTVCPTGCAPVSAPTCPPTPACPE